MPASNADWTISRSATRIRSATSPRVCRCRRSIPGAPEPTSFDEAGAGRVALVALFRRGLRPRVEAEPVAFWRWIDVRCRDMNELRRLLTDPGSRSPRRQTASRHDRLPVRRERGRADPARPPGNRRDPRPRRASCWWITCRSCDCRPVPADAFPDDLPPVLKDTVARLDRLIADAADESEKAKATRALAHLYKLLQSQNTVPRTGAPRVAGRRMKLHRLRCRQFRRDPRRRHRVRSGTQRAVRAERSRQIDAGRRHPPGAAASSHVNAIASSTSGGPAADDPVVELTFETEAQRIWRVRKEFGKSGSSLLQESKNGRDFDDVERGRKVDGKLREILRWGIPEPGGAGGGKGLPTSFLATALLSTQADVTAVLRGSLQDDPTGSGKEQIAAALQAVAQDPLFVSLLRSVQARRDEAYTDKGAKKTAEEASSKPRRIG